MNGFNNSAVKAKNRGLVLELLISQQASTRTEIAEKASLSKMTATNIVTELISEGVLEEHPILDGSSKGRPSLLLSLSPKAPKAIGLVIRGSHHQIGLLDLYGRAVSSISVDAELTSDPASANPIINGIGQLLMTAASERIFAISVAAENLKTASGTLAVGNGELDLVSILKDRFQLPVCCDELYQAFGEFEFKFGRAKDSNGFIFLDISDGIGSALFVQGSESGAPKYIGGNIGHISIDYNGLSCHCGNHGCLEAYVSTAAMEKKLQEITKLKLDFKGFCEIQAKKNDSRIDWALKDMMDKLGFALISVSNIVSPERILLGGQAIYLPERYLAKLEKAVNSKKLSKGLESKVLKASFGTEENQRVAIMPLLTDVFEGLIQLY